MNSDKDNLFIDKNILVFGLGKSGLSSLKKLAGNSKSIAALDNNPDFILPEDYIKLYENSKIKFFIGSSENSLNNLLDKTDLIIVSPGISMSLPFIKKALRKKIKIWSELELAWRFMNDNQKKNTIAITGTNGKTTVTTLIGKILNDFGLNALTCGNIGNPLIDTLKVKEFSQDIETDEKEYLDNAIRVIEVSSFQLENIYTFSPHVAIILNITDDHIDRHDSISKYSRIKFKISANQGLADYLIVNSDDKNIIKLLKNIDLSKEIKSNLLRMSLDIKKSVEIFYQNEEINYCFKDIDGSIKINGRNLIGNHNISNIMSAVGAAKLFNVDDLSISGSVKNFIPLHHRLEYIGTVNGVKCYNDSKATNPDAVLKALEHFQKEVTLILGGLDKGMDFKSLIPAVNKKVLNLILIGSSKELLYKIFSETPHNYVIYKAATLEEAVSKGMEVTKKNNTFLLSPACASMDMFKDYKDRGNQFKRMILSQTK
jgi:UDP-N-acetylmuramoylalanine--D-glutamate ligase